MIRLGHIEYSNCFPVHAQLVGDATPPNIEIVTGTPSQLNRALEAGEIDVAPSSSIEYARHLGSYRLLPDFVIGSDGAVGSILLESSKPIEQLQGANIAVPTASATSVVLLKILLQLRYGVSASFHWFDQEHAAPNADAVLFIGDVALRRSSSLERSYDLGAEWKAWTSLPFVFAAWQTSAPSSRDAELQTLSEQLRASRQYFLENAAMLARSNAAAFGVEANRLLSYWQSLRYDFDESMQRGLLRYYELAAKLGETPAVERLFWT
ncbi:MAG TPA: menaquinone biosynthesis protein [Longimicrobiales bacterium]|nr:menaquinone biosynthesis protein [Longimicrobiales bacterium]